MGIFGRLIFILCAALAGPFPAAQEIPVVEFSVSEFVVTGDNPLPPKDSDAILAEFVGTYSGLDANSARTATNAATNRRTET